MGFDDDLFSNIRGQILALEPIPPLDKIFNMVQQEENHKRMIRIVKIEMRMQPRSLTVTEGRSPLKQLATGCHVHIV